jgi:GNAT superfamily N-acetyltransferase
MPASAKPSFIRPQSRTIGHLTRHDMTSIGSARSEFKLRPATAGDVPTILACIQGLAEYEHLSHECMATEALLHQTLFGSERVAEVTLAFSGDTPAGFALWFRSYSTFLARPGIYLEDLFVYPAYRGKGLGRQLLASLAQTAVQRQYGRVEWAVLNWNADAIRFYESLGARPMNNEWTVYRVAGEALVGLAGQSDGDDGMR